MMNGDGRLRDRSMAELLGKLSAETSQLIRQEVELAKAELTQQGRILGSGAAMFGGSTLFGLGAFGALTAALILALAIALPAWAAAAIVTLIYAGVAAVMAMRGKRQIQDAKPVPEQTVETMKENIEWAKSRTRSGVR